MSQLNVVLLGHTPDPEKAVAMAARLCYSGAGIGEILHGLDEDDVSRLVRRLRDMGHFSPFEHASFSFGISGVSRALSHQLVRHRIASFSQKSQRYVSEDQFDFVVPASVFDNQEALRLFSEGMRQIQGWYNSLVDLGIPREDARYVLPNACATQLVCTFNARSLLNFFALRLCARAQPEIRDLARRMLGLAREVAPTVFEKAGPPCVSEGRCREGRMSCGRRKDLEGGLDRPDEPGMYNGPGS